MGIWFIRVALLYLIAGMAFGMYIGSTEQYKFADVHAHTNLLGFAVLSIAGLVYSVWPEAGNNRLAVIHFWLQNVGLWLFLPGIYSLNAGNSAGLPFTISGALIAIVAILVFTANVWMNVKERGAKT